MLEKYREKRYKDKHHQNISLPKKPVYKLIRMRICNHRYRDKLIKSFLFACINRNFRLPSLILSKYLNFTTYSFLFLRLYFQISCSISNFLYALLWYFFSRKEHKTYLSNVDKRNSSNCTKHELVVELYKMIAENVKFYTENVKNFFYRIQISCVNFLFPQTTIT